MLTTNLVFSFHSAFAIASVVADDCSYDEVKKCYNLEYMFSEGKFQWPTDDGSVQTLCGKLMEGGQCFKAFVDKCSKLPAAKEQFNKKMAALKLYHESVCGSPDGRKGFLERVQCYSNPNVITPVKAAHKKFVAMVEKLPSYDKAQRKQAFCCSILFLKDAAKGPVSANCKADTVEYLKGLLQTVVSYLGYSIQQYTKHQFMFTVGCFIQRQVRLGD